VKYADTGIGRNCNTLQVEATVQESKYLKATIENVQKLLAIPVLHEFETRDLEELLKRSKIRKFSAGEQIIKEGDFDSLLYFLLSGTVRIAKGRVELAVLKRSGDIFGEMGMLAHTDRSASAYAVSEVVCLTTDATQINTLSGNDRVAFSYLIYRVFAEILAERLRVTSMELTKAREQIERFGNNSQPGYLDSADKTKTVEIKPIPPV
jgi:CRP/FNR family transcriptional regulator, cyclic AMP receptor protein